MNIVSARFTAAFAICVFVGIPACGAQQTPKDKADVVRSSGCVRAGVEAGCLVLTDAKDRKNYNLFFSNDKPSVGTAISFEGTIHKGPTLCMQGIPVRVSTWSPVKMQCPEQ